MAEYKTPLERMFGEKSVSILLAMVIAVAMTSFVTFFELRRASTEQTKDFLNALDKQGEDIRDLQRALDQIATRTSETPKLDKSLTDIQSQLDIMRRDASTAHADIGRIEQKLTELLALVKDIKDTEN